MEFRPDRSIRTRLFLVIALLVTGIVAFQVMFFPARQQAASVEALDAKARAVVGLVAQNVAPGLDFDDADQVAQQLTRAATDRELIYIAVYDASGKLVSAVHPEAIPANRRASTDAIATDLVDTELRVAAPIKTQTGGTGMLNAGFSTASIAEQRWANLRLALAFGLLVEIIGLGVAWYVGSAVGRRMGEMAGLAEKVAAGRLDVVRVEVGAEDEIGRMAHSFNTMLDGLGALRLHVDTVAQGDLTKDVAVSGDLGASFQQMVSRQRELVMQIAATSAEIRASSAEIQASARGQEDGATEQAAVVEQTRRTMQTLLDAASRIGESSQLVLDHAERTRTNIDTISERIGLLAGHVQRIGDVLEVIKDIANKADLLSLNAALEGTRAGEAGRGFSQVASRMQRLTENVMGAVRDIKSLTSDIREATSATVLATEEATKRAAGSAESARQIRMTIQQQLSGTEQVSQSMDDISHVIARAVAGSTELSATATQLASLSERLEQQMQEFRLPTKR